MGDQQETSNDKRRRIKREYRNRKRKRLDRKKKEERSGKKDKLELDKSGSDELDKTIMIRGMNRKNEC